MIRHSLLILVLWCYSVELPQITQYDREEALTIVIKDSYECLYMNRPDPYLNKYSLWRICQ